MNHLATVLAAHEPAILYGAGALVVAILVIAALLFLRNRKTSRLRAQFGPEYDHAVAQSGRGKAEAGLRAAEKRAGRETVSAHGTLLTSAARSRPTPENDETKQVGSKLKN